MTISSNSSLTRFSVCISTHLVWCCSATPGDSSGRNSSRPCQCSSGLGRWGDHLFCFGALVIRYYRIAFRKSSWTHHTECLPHPTGANLATSQFIEDHCLIGRAVLAHFYFPYCFLQALRNLWVLLARNAHSMSPISALDHPSLASSN